jgi:hypothetical protein
MKLFCADRKKVEGAWMGFEAEAWDALYIGTGLDPNEGANRPSVNVVFSSHRGGNTIYAPPDLLALARDPENRKPSARELVDKFYRTRPGNEPPWQADFLGSYRMAPSVGAEITLKWDALRLSAVDYAADGGISEAAALEALTRYVYLHELAHYFTHWGKRPDVVARGGAGEAVCEIEWRKNYLSWNSGGAECFKEGIAELACVTAFELRSGDRKWDEAAEAKQWLNGKLTGVLKKRYVDSAVKIEQGWRGDNKEGIKINNIFWCSANDEHRHQNANLVGCTYICRKKNMLGWIHKWKSAEWWALEEAIKIGSDEAGVNLDI